MSRIRWRTSRPSESFFIRSLGFSGSRVASAPFPPPRFGRLLVRVGEVTVGLLPAHSTHARARAQGEKGAADRGRGEGRAGGPGSARSATDGAGDERQVDVQTRDEQ